MNNDALTQLRTDIDAIDDQIISLLKKRAQIVKHVGELKRETSLGQSFIRAGREASMLRNLTSKASGILPQKAVATIWRMIISASLSLEQDISIYSYIGENKNCFWLAREYFGTFLAHYTEENLENLIQKIASNPSAVGVLPLLDNSKSPWWVRPKDEKNNIYVFARIPFVADDSELVQPVLAIANTKPEASGEDVSLIAITTGKNEEDLQKIFVSKQLAANIISRCGNNFLVELAGFVPISDKIIAEITAILGEQSIVRLLGSYAVPISL